PCDQDLYQSRTHIIVQYPLHEHARHILRTVSPTITLPILFNTKRGLNALANFFARSNAFKK
ncbi:hypothetical protein WOLCODRAFT_33963, partial [Wolfiporia cocos MD-104 SS10]